MDNIDVFPDGSELMSSEFFDSVLSLENNFEENLFLNFEDDLQNLSDGSQSDGTLSPQSYYSESDKSTYSSTENMDESASVLSSLDGIDDSMFLSLLEPQVKVKVEKVNEEEILPIIKSPQAVVSSSRPSNRPTKILIQNPSNKKFIAKPMINAAHFKKQPLTKPKTQILKVHQVSNNGRPVLLPLNVKSIKILNSSADLSVLTNLHQLKRQKVEVKQEPRPIEEDDDDTNVVSSTNQAYPALSLSPEEKKLLVKEGIQLPTHHPLTKNEERELKRIRRKIRNKISAQDSRKRKKEYVDGLEERVKRGSEENKHLQQRVKELQQQNKTLIAHVNRLQALICNTTTSKATPSTCLMVVLLSALLVSLPNMRLFEKQQMSTETEQVSIRRSLLSSPAATEEDLNMDEFLIFNGEDSEETPRFAEDAHDVENNTDKELSKMIEEMGKKYKDFITEKNNSDKMNIFGRMFESVKGFLEQNKPELFDKKPPPPDYGGIYNKKGFIEPDVDDYIAANDGPPIKRVRYNFDETHHNIHSEQVVSTTTVQNPVKE